MKILAAALILFGIIVVFFGIFKLDKESHKRQDYRTAGSDLASSIFGQILAILPWWIVKIVMIVIGFGLIFIGIMMFIEVDSLLRSLGRR